MISRPRRLPARLALAMALFVGMKSALAIAAEWTGGSWRFLKGTNEASLPDTSAWRSRGFSDSGWLGGTQPFFYGEPLAGTELADMNGRYSSVYLRKSFHLDAADKIGSLVFAAVSDDGFIAWINGQEVARHNVPDGALPFSATASGAAAEPLAEERFEIDIQTGILTNGINVLAVHAFNSSLGGSSDFVFSASLQTEMDTIAPVIVERVPAAGSAVEELFTVEITFSEPVSGLVAGDLMINGVPATNVVAGSPQQYLFSFTQPESGEITFSWSESHRITDRRVTGNPFFGTNWTVRLDPSLADSKIEISEFLASNQKLLLDEDRDDSDWIEIHNAGVAGVNLSGWSLTDDSADPRKWVFPNVSLAPDAYLIVFASQKNKTNPTNRLHTNFRLSPDGEYLGLRNPAGRVISEFAPVYPPQTANISFGSVAGSAGGVYFATPSPGSVNLPGGEGFAPRVDFSHNGTLFVQPFELALTSALSNGIIRYTIDGRYPVETSAVYAGPIPITNSIEIRARSFAPGLVGSECHSETYIRLTNSPAHLAAFTSSLPIMVVSTVRRASIGASRNVNVTFSLHEPVLGRASLLNRPDWMTRGAAKLRGSSTEGLSKSSFAIEWRDELDQDKEHGILGMPAESEWVLYAPNVYDKPLIHNPFIHNLTREMGDYAVRTRFVEVYLQTQGGQIMSNQFNGIYVLEERIGPGKNRVDIDKLDAEDVTFPEITGGYQMKIDRTDPFDSGFSAGGQGMVWVDPKEVEMRTPQRAPQRQYLIGYFNEFSRALSNTNAAIRRDPELGFRKYINLKNWTDFHIVEVLSGNVDAIVLSTYLYKPRNGPIHFGPHWDFDRALGSTDGRDSNPRVWNTGPFFSSWFTSVFRDPDAWQGWVDRYQELRESHLSITNMNRLIFQLSEQVRPIYPREIRRWADLRPRGVGYDSELKIMRDWISNRVTWIDGQMTQPPQLSSPGGAVTPGFQVTLSAPEPSVIYYTLDGTDPRQSQFGTNAVATGARIYEGPITLNSNTRLVARARNVNKRQTGGPPSSTPWSRPVAATFSVTPPPLTVTELMYHPVAPAGGDFSDSDFEFIELRNISNQPVELAGYQFTRGIEFRFTTTNGAVVLEPGGRIAVVKNRAAFSLRYPGLTRVAGPFSGNFSDSGERVTLVGPLLEPIVDFTYRDDWEQVSDGIGFSLVVRDESSGPGMLGNASAWTVSSAAGGSPAMANPVRVDVPAIVISEILANPQVAGREFVELYNPTGQRVDVSGWYLSDRESHPGSNRLPVGTQVPANGYLALTVRLGSLKLSPDGGEVALFSAKSEGELTGWMHAVRYGPTPTGQAVGGSGEYLVPLAAATPGASNAVAVIPGIVISQIQTAGAEDDGWIQIWNAADRALPLFDPDRPSNRWRLRGGIEFELPRVTLSPGETLVVAGFDPIGSPAKALRFREQFGPIAPGNLLGPFEGRLNEQEDEVRLQSPIDPKGHDEDPFMVVEVVSYRAVPTTSAELSLWPLTPGGAMTRRSPLQVAHLPGAWLAAINACPSERDRNGNGLPDSVEVSLGADPGDTGPGRLAILGADPDGDGFTNLAEYFSGTPINQAGLGLSLTAVLREERVVRLRFPSRFGATYRLESRGSLASGDWAEVSTIIGDGGVMVLEHPFVTQEQYYRLVTP